MNLSAHLNKYFLPYQVKWIIDDAPKKIYPKSRRIGVTFATTWRTVWKSFGRKNHDTWVLSRDEGKAKEFIDLCKMWAVVLGGEVYGLGYDKTGLYEDDEYIDPKTAFTVFRITFPSGSRIMALSSNPDAIAGVGGSVILDEFALHKDQKKLYDVALPCITWGGQLEIISTHRGIETFFNELVTDAKDQNKRGFSLHQTTVEDAVAGGFVDKLNSVRASNGFEKYTSISFLEDKKQECSTEQAYLQEYMCQPTSLDDTLLHWDWIVRSAIAVNPDPEKERHYMGVDVGRYKDLTCFWIISVKHNVYYTKCVEVLENTSFDDQLERMRYLVDKYKIHKICLDNTGPVGIKLGYRAELKWGKFKANCITFTNQIKQDLAAGVYEAFEREQIKIPDVTAIKADLYSVHKVVSSVGTLRYQAPVSADGHADRFWALALAIEAAGPLELPKDRGISIPTDMVPEDVNSAVNQFINNF